MFIVNVLIMNWTRVFHLLFVIVVRVNSPCLEALSLQVHLALLEMLIRFRPHSPLKVPVVFESIKRYSHPVSNELLIKELLEGILVLVAFELQLISHQLKL